MSFICISFGVLHSLQILSRHLETIIRYYFLKIVTLKSGHPAVQHLITRLEGLIVLSVRLQIPINLGDFGS